MGFPVVLNSLPDIRHGWWVQNARRIYALRIWNLCDRSSMCTSIIWNTVLYFSSVRGTIAKRICKFQTCRLGSVTKNVDSVQKRLILKTVSGIIDAPTRNPKTHSEPQPATVAFCWRLPKFTLHMSGSRSILVHAWLLLKGWGANHISL